MKTQSSRRVHGFTLVELLVVIAIIAVLAGAGFAAGNAAIQKAKKTTAMATCTAIESAVSNFYTEYGAMPTDAAADATVTTKDVTLLNVLLGLETGTSILNPRKIKFLSVKEGKKGGSNGGMNGLLYNPAGSQVIGLFDPWGGYYNVVMDANYDDKVTVQPTGGASVTLNGRKAAAWSAGADGVAAGKGKPADDVVTWNK